MSAGASKKVVARIFGGLGNQLFIYAAARRLALASGAELVLDDVSGFVRDRAYRRVYELDRFHVPCRKATRAERLEPFPRLRRRLLRMLNRRRPFHERSYLCQEGPDYEPRLLQWRPKGTVYLEGYWQSERYFQGMADSIRAELRIRPPTDPENVTVAGHIAGVSSVAVHVRFFDDPDQQVALPRIDDPSAYYVRAVQKMESLAPNSHYFIFSDRPEAARARIPLPYERVRLVTHNDAATGAYADLWLMTQCRHCIIANSTFSWWGAWLTETSAKRVIAPEPARPEVQRSWRAAGLLPDRWIKV